MATLSHRPTTNDVASLLSCPVEIRVKIYRHLLVASHLLQPYAIWDSWLPNRTEGSGIYISILATCKQVTLEATPILYASNILGFDGSGVMNEWLDTINAESVQAVQNAEITESYPTMDLDGMKKVFMRCTGLKRLHLACGTLPEPWISKSFEFAKRVLKDHPNLRMVACDRWEGWPIRGTKTWVVGSITLAADIEDLLPRDGIIFDEAEKVIEGDA